MAIALATAVLAPSPAPGPAAPQAGSTFNTGPDGLAAAYRVLAERHSAVQWQRPLRRLPTGVDRLVIWQPEQMTAREWDDLLDWVEDGGRLIISAHGGAWRGRLAGQAGARRPGTALPAAVDGITSGVTTVNTGSDVLESTERPVLVHLTRVDGAPVLVSWPHGQGRIYWSADAEWLTNARIGGADNIILATGLMAPVPGRQVAFDELHHGFVTGERWWQILRPNLSALIAQLLLALAILYWARGARFGSPLAALPRPPRAAVEYVRSMSLLYRRARAHPVVLAALHLSLKRALSRLTGDHRQLSNADLAALAGPRMGLSPGEIQTVLDRTQTAGFRRESDLLDLARQVEAMQRRVRNAGFRDRHAGGEAAK